MEARIFKTTEAKSVIEIMQKHNCPTSHETPQLFSTPSSVSYLPRMDERNMKLQKILKKKRSKQKLKKKN